MEEAARDAIQDSKDWEKVRSFCLEGIRIIDDEFQLLGDEYHISPLLELSFKLRSYLASSFLKLARPKDAYRTTALALNLTTGYENPGWSNPADQFGYPRMARIWF